VAIFILNTPTLPSPIKGEGVRGRGNKGGDVTSLEGGRKERRFSFLSIFFGSGDPILPGWE